MFTKDAYRTNEALAPQAYNPAELQTPQMSNDLILDAVITHSLLGTQPSEYGFKFTDAPEYGIGEDGRIAQILTPSIAEAPIAKTGKLKTVAHKLGRLGVSFKNDIKDNDKKGEAAGWAALTVGTQAADRARLVLIYGPPLAVDISNNTNNSLLGPLVLAGIFAATNFGTGEALTQSMDHFKRTKESFRNDFPLTVELFANALAGVKSDEITKEPTPEDRPTEDPPTIDRDELTKDPWFKRLKLPLPVRRGMTGVGLGSTAFVATSSMLGNSNDDVRKINAKVTRDTSIFIVAVGAGLLEGIKRMYNMGWESQAKFFSDHAQDGKTWLGVACTSIAYTFASNTMIKRKLKKSHKAEKNAPIDSL